MNVLNDIIKEHAKHDPRRGYDKRESARAELAQLRAAADELQRIRELIDPLNGQSVYDAVDALLHDESSAEIYRIDMAEQERKLDEAREIINSGASIYNGSKGYVSAYNIRCQQWLLANPAPEAEPQP